MSSKNKNKDFISRFFLHLHKKRWYFFRTEMPFQIFHVSHSYLRQFFLTIAFFFIIGSPWIACFYFLINAALWLGYEDDMDEEDVLDDDMEGEDDWIWEDINMAAILVIIMGLAIAEDETKLLVNNFIFDKHFADNHFNYIRFIEIFHNNSKQVSVVNIAFFLSLCEWDHHLIEIFGHPFFSLISNELQTVSILDSKKIFNKTSDNIFFPTNARDYNYKSLYERDTDIETLNVKTNIALFFYALYYKFQVLRNFVDAHIIYDIILSDLNNFFFYINKKNHNKFFFKYLVNFKKKLKSNNFFFKFNSYSLKFIVDDIKSSKNRFQNFKDVNKLRRANRFFIKMLIFYFRRNKNKLFFNYPLKNNLFLLLIMLRFKKLPYEFRIRRNNFLKNFLISNKNYFLKFNRNKWISYQKKKNYQKWLKNRYNSSLNLEDSLKTKSTKVKFTYADDYYNSPILVLKKRKISFFEYQTPLILNHEFYKMRKKNLFWNNFYNIVDQIFMDPILDEKVYKSKNTAAIGIMSDHFISISKRKINDHMIESRFLLNIMKFKPILFDIKIGDFVNRFDILRKFYNNTKIRKLIERNIHSFIKITYKDLLLTGACSYEQMWYSLGFYFPLLRMIISRKLLHLLIKNNRLIIKKKKS